MKNKVSIKKWNSSAPEPNKQLNGKSFSNHNKDPRLEELISGKRIAFVGPSSHLKGLGSGEIIDSYDIVVRAGQTFKVPESEHKDFGKITDIVCHSFNRPQRAVCLQNVDFFKELKYIICSMVSLKQINEHNEFFPKLKAPFQNVDDEYILKIWEDVGTVANSGLAGLIVLMNYNVKEIYVTGLSFYNMGKYGDIYYGDYMSQANKMGAMKDGATPKNGRDDLHNQRAQILYFKELYKNNKEIIKLDEYLEKNLLSYE